MFKESVDKNLGPSPEDVDEVVAGMVKAYKALAKADFASRGQPEGVYEAMNTLRELIPSKEWGEIEDWAQ